MVPEIFALKVNHSCSILRMNPEISSSVAMEEREKRKRLADYRLRVNEVMSVKKVSDIDQSEMLRHYSDEKMHRMSKSSPLNLD